MTIKYEARTLTCELTEDELLARGDEMAKTYIQVAALDLEKKRLTAKIKPLDERIQELVLIIDSKQEERRVECRWVYSYDIGIKALIRPDTGEEIETGRIKDHERQQQLELETRGRVDEGLALGAEENLDNEQTVCLNTSCLRYEASEPNHCCILEYVSECDNPKGTGAPKEETTDARPETEKEEEGSEAGDEVAGSALGDDPDQPVSLCITCRGLCGDFTPGTAVTECPGFDCALGQNQIDWRDNTCKDWRDCNYKEKCFSPANEEEPDCLSERPETLADRINQIKTARASGMSLSETMASAMPTIQEKEFTCKICGFDGGTKVYLTRHVEREHNLTMTQYKKQFPASQTALQLARDKRAKLIKGAK